jgi:hypothetical protein
LEEVKSMLELLDKTYADMANARAREIELAKAGKKDPLLVVVVITSMVLWIGCYFTLVFVKIPPENMDMFREFYITVRDIAFLTFSYFLGSTVSSKMKTALIERMSMK